jgi:Ankyrin repeats (3 copies)
VLQHEDVALDAGTIANAAARGHIPCMEFLLSRQCPRDATACTAAVASRRPNTMRWLRERKFPWDATACTAAAGSSQLAVLRYLHEHDCPWDATAFTAAAGRKQMAVLQYLHQQGCPWDATACTAAARRGDLEAVRYLHSSGCPWEAGTACEKAATCGSLDVIKYILEHETEPLTPAQLSQVLNAAGRYNQLPTAQWLRQQKGAEFPPLLVYKDCYDAHSSSTVGWHYETLDWARSEGCTASNDLRVSSLRFCLHTRAVRTLLCGMLHSAGSGVRGVVVLHCACHTVCKHAVYECVR